MDLFSDYSRSAPKPRTDRFVLPREAIIELSRMVPCDAQPLLGEHEIWSKKYLFKKNYKKALDEVFLVTPPKKQRPYCEEKWSWPCSPRQKTTLTSTYMSLNFPTIDSIVGIPDILDWSDDDNLVGAVSTRYLIWNWNTKINVCRGVTECIIQCCKFRPGGKYILFGTCEKMVEVHCAERGKYRYAHKCLCPSPHCIITAINWSPTSNAFVTGCSSGMVCAMSHDCFEMRAREVFEGAIRVAKISPNARFVATAGLDADEVVILSWPDLAVFRKLPANKTVQGVTWHPWRSALLGMGFADGPHSRIALWEAGSGRYREERIGRAAYKVDTMMFSDKTGELLISLSSAEESQSTIITSQLVVLSDFDTAVDQLQVRKNTGTDRVKTMVFSPDGTNLASATADDDLIFWNFLPKDYKKKNGGKKFSAIPEMLDIVTYGFSLR